MRSALDRLVTEKALSHINDYLSPEAIDFFDTSEGLKNVCAKVSVSLSDRLDEITGFLGVSKRRFLEAAMIDAIAQAEDIMRAEGLFKVLGESNKSEETA